MLLVTAGLWIIQTVLLIPPDSHGKRSDEQHENVIKLPAEERLIPTDSLVLSPRRWRQTVFSNSGKMSRTMVAEVRGDSPSLTLLSAHNFYSPAATLVPDMK